MSKDSGLTSHLAISVSSQCLLCKSKGSIVTCRAEVRGGPEPFSVEGIVKQGKAPFQRQATPDMKQQMEWDSIRDTDKALQLARLCTAPKEVNSLGFIYFKKDLSV